VDALEDIKKRKRRPTKHMTVTLPIIPDEYLNFAVEHEVVDDKVEKVYKFRNKFESSSSRNAILCNK